MKAQELEIQTEAILKRDIAKTLSLEKILTKNYWNLKGKIQSYQHKEKVFSATVTAATQALSLTCLLGTVLIGAYFTIQGQVTIGGLTACTLISGKIMQPVFSLIRYLIRLPEVRHRTDELDKIFNCPQESKEYESKLSSKDITITIKDLTIEANNIRIYDKLKFKFEPNNIYLLNSFTNLETERLYKTLTTDYNTHPNNIFLNGTPIERINKSLVRKNIFHIQKEGDFFNGSILDNISLFSDNKKLAELCASLVSLDSYYNYLVDGYETALDTEALENLPISLLQRIQIARALYFRPKILLIDKIDQDMDNETKIIFKNILKKLKAEMTILIATENEYKKMFYDYKLEMTDGKIRIEA